MVGSCTPQYITSTVSALWVLSNSYLEASKANNEARGGRANSCIAVGCFVGVVIPTSSPGRGDYEHSTLLPPAPAKPYLKLPAASSNGNQVAVQQVVWFHSMPLHGGVDLKGSVKVGVVISHAGVDRSSVQLQGTGKEYIGQRSSIAQNLRFQATSPPQKTELGARAAHQIANT